MPPVPLLNGSCSIQVTLQATGSDGLTPDPLAFEKNGVSHFKIEIGLVASLEECLDRVSATRYAAQISVSSRPFLRQFRTPRDLKTLSRLKDADGGHDHTVERSTGVHGSIAVEEHMRSIRLRAI